MSNMMIVKYEMDVFGVVFCIFNWFEVWNVLNYIMVNDICWILECVVNEDGLCALIFMGVGGKLFVSGVDIVELLTCTFVDVFFRINNSFFWEIEMFLMLTIVVI